MDLAPRLRRVVLTTGLVLAAGGCGPWSGEVVVAVEAPLEDAGSEPPPPPPEDAGIAFDASLVDASAPRPDLALAFIEAPPASVVPGTGVTAEVRVASTVQAPAPASSVRIDLVPARPETPVVRVGEALVPPLGPGGVATLEVELWVPRGTLEQRYELVATVDPDDLLDEANEQNNRRVGGATWVSAVEVTPIALDFGTVGLGCTATRTVQLHNRSQLSAFFSRAEADHPAFEALPPRLPVPLPSGARLDVPVRYAPRAAGVDRGTLFLEHDQIVGPVTLALTGAAVPEPLRAEHFTAWPQARVDVLVVVDDSPTMVEEQVRLGVATSAFLDDLDARRVDYRLGVTTTDVSITGTRGALRGTPAVLTPDTPFARHAFAQSVRAGISGSEAERGLDAARLALSPGVNPTFRRAEAALWVLWLSDEDDASTDDVETYFGDLEDETGPRGASGLFVTTVTSDPAAPCPSATAPGIRYRALTDAAQGDALDLCAFAWDLNLPAALPARFGAQLRFELARAPLQGSTRVFVDGVPATDGWRLEGRTVEFEADRAPAAGATVRVEYRTEC